MTKWVYNFGAGENEGNASLRNLLGGKGANLAEMASIGLPVPARLHHHHRSLHRLLRQQPQLPGRAEGPGGRRAGPHRGCRRPQVRRQGQAAAGVRALRRARLHAGHDGHRAEPRPERRHRARASADGAGRSALRLGLLPPLHPDVRLRGAGRRPSPLRGDHRARQARSRRDRGHRADRAATGSRWSRATRTWWPKRPASRSRRTRRSSSGARSARCSAPG